MSNVIDFHTREPLKLKRPKKVKEVENLIECLYQRRFQVSDILIVSMDKVSNQIIIHTAVRDDLNRRLMHSFFDDFMRYQSDFDPAD